MREDGYHRIADLCEEIILRARGSKHFSKVEALADTIAEIAISYSTPPFDCAWVEYGLTPQENKVFSRLVYQKGRVVTREALFIAMDADEINEEARGPRHLDVLICKLRKKLKPTLYTIKNHFDVGYELVTKPDAT